MMGVQSLGPLAPRRVAEHAVSPRPVSDGDDFVGAVPAHQMHPESEPAAAPSSLAASSELEREAWVVLMSVGGLGPVSFAALLRAFGTARAVLEAASGPDGPTRLLRALADSAADLSAADNQEADGAVFDACVTQSADGFPGDPSAGRSANRRRPSIGRELATRICDAVADGPGVVERMRSLGLTAVILEEPAYPGRLREVELPPPLLYLQGSASALACLDSVAVVGTRWPTDKGRLIAGWIGSALARAGAVVVSGLAVGIDGAAHAAVVAEGGRTVAVLGGGHARLFPRAHARLAERIVDGGGAVVSEHPPDTQPSRGTFPRRNRLVSGLSDATVVVEAGVRSGALITAGWALEQGRECFLVPGALDSPASAGCHAFLRSFPGQARIVAGVAELIEDLEIGRRASSGTGEPVGDAAEPELDRALGPIRARTGNAPESHMARPGRAAVLATLGPVERVLAAELARGAATADQLAARTSLASAAVLSALTLLELRGFVSGAYGRYSPAGPLATWSA